MARPVYRKSERTPEELERIRAVREKFHREKPTVEDLEGQGAVFVPMGAVMALRQLVHDLRRERERQGLTLGELAERTGIDEPELMRLETGKDLNPTFSTVAKVAQGLGKVISFAMQDLPAPRYGPPPAAKATGGRRGSGRKKPGARKAGEAPAG
jgi:hypothetical protein